MTGTRSVTATFIQNNVTLAPASRREGDYGTTILSFPVGLTAAADHAVSVNYTTAGGSGSATANKDYLVVADSISFLPGETSKSIDIIVFPDKKSEVDETFTLTLSSATGASLPAIRTATGTIIDDDGGFDVNRDGLADLAIGSRNANAGGGAASGAVYIFYGTANPAGAMSAASADLTFVGENSGDLFGVDITTGDFNGDDDLVVCARDNDEGASNSGSVYVFYGPFSQNTIDASAADVKIVGNMANDHFGVRLDAADVNADGISDMLISGRDTDSTGDGAGAAYIFYGSPSLAGRLTAGQADAIFLGETSNDRFAVSIANAGDINGDGREDIIVGADRASNGTSDSGVAYLFYGASTWAMTTIGAANADVTLRGLATNDNFGYSVGGNVDVNGDGKDDLLVGARLVGASDDGAAYVFFGGGFPPMQTLTATQADFTLVGNQSGQLGFAISGVGDVNGDGIGDFAVGARSDSQAASGAGRAHLVLGSTNLTGTVAEGSGSVGSIGGATQSDFVGGYLSKALDINRDGYHDFLIGAENAGVPNAGAAYLILGSSSGSLPASVSAAASTINGSSSGDFFGVGLQ